MTDPKTVGGGSLLIAWQLKGKKVLVVGGGEVGAHRIDSLLTTDAHIHLVSPSAGLHTRTKQLLETHPSRVTHIDQAFTFPNGEQKNGTVDIGTYDMVLTALDDSNLSQKIVEACRAIRVPVNAADIPDLCDFYFGGQIRDGPLQIMVSTNGNGPRIAALIKDRVKKALSGKEGEALRKVGTLRAKLKERAPGIGGEVGKRRMRWMSRVCEQWSLEELSLLDDDIIENLLEHHWEKDEVPVPCTASKSGTWYDFFKRGGVGSLPSVASFVAGVAFARILFTAFQAKN